MAHPGITPGKSGIQKHKKIGQGGFGNVYQCTYHMLGGGSRDAVVKEIRASSMSLGKDIRRELDNLLHLRATNHENVLQVVNYYESEYQGIPQMNLIFEMLEGDMVKYAEKWPTRFENKSRFQYFTRCTLGGLAFIHEHKMLHQDIKPENIFFVGSKPTRFKIADFGIAVRPHEKKPCFGGTRGFTGPEYDASNGYTIGRKADIWSMFVTFAVLLDKDGFDYKLNRSNNDEARNLVQKARDWDELAIYQDMAYWDPDKRPTAREMLAKVQANRPLPNIKGGFKHREHRERNYTLEMKLN